MHKSLAGRFLSFAARRSRYLWRQPWHRRSRRRFDLSQPQLFCRRLLLAQKKPPTQSPGLTEQFYLSDRTLQSPFSSTFFWMAIAYATLNVAHVSSSEWLQKPTSIALTASAMHLLGSSESSAITASLAPGSAMASC